MHLSTVVLWLFSMNLGVAFGAGIYEARIVVPLWASKIPIGFKELETGRRFWGFVTTAPLSLLCIGSLVIAYRSAEPVRSACFSAALLALAERLLTFGYFIPTIVRLEKGAFGSGALQKFKQWQTLNLLRNGITLLAWIAATRTLILAAS